MSDEIADFYDEGKDIGRDINMLHFDLSDYVVSQLKETEFPKAPRTVDDVNEKTFSLHLLCIQPLFRKHDNGHFGGFGTVKREGITKFENENR